VQLLCDITPWVNALLAAQKGQASESNARQPAVIQPDAWPPLTVKTVAGDGRVGVQAPRFLSLVFLVG